MERSLDKPRIFLDSGAYSAHTRGIKIDIQDYISFIKERVSLCDVYANLDVISINGSRSNRATAEQTLKNQRIMEEAGLHPLPCFHYGEPYEYLQYYTEQYNYVGLGMATAVSRTIPFLTECFSKYICDRFGMPKVRVHGYGISSIEIILQFPFYSVDSTAWMIIGRYGLILVPRRRNGQWVYTQNPYKVAVSTRSPRRKTNGKHIDNMSYMERKMVLDYIHEKGFSLGKSDFKLVDKDYILAENEKWTGTAQKISSVPREVEIIIDEGISNIDSLRDELNAVYFAVLQQYLPCWPRGLNIS